MKKKQPKHIMLNLGRADSPAVQEALATFEGVQTKGDDYGIRYLWI
jgi:hypothetical protein